MVAVRTATPKPAKKKGTGRAILDYLGDGKRIPRDRIASATVEERILSVGPMIIAKASKLEKHLNHLSKGSSFDIEDIAVELWIELSEKDHYWDQSKGEYTTFAGLIMENAASDLRNEAGIVQAPRGSASKLRAFGELAAAGCDFSEKARQDELQLIRALAAASTITEATNTPWEGDLVAEVIDDEDTESTRLAADDLIRILSDPDHVAVLSMSYGVNNHREHETSEIAYLLKMTPREVIETRKAAILELRRAAAGWLLSV